MVFWEVIQWLADVEGIFAILRIFGLRKFARWLLQRRGIIMAHGLDFYVNRIALKKHHSIEDQLKKAKDIYALWLSGTNAFTSGGPVGNIKQLILPNPNCESLKTFEKKLPTHSRLLSQEIRDTTRLAKEEHQIDVKWHNAFIGFSLMIGDPTLPSGWAQIEMVMPYAAPNDRPSFQIKNSKQPVLFSHIWRVYQDIANNSSEPDLGTRNGTRTIEGDDSLSDESKKYFRSTFKTLNKNDIEYIKQMLITGHAHNPPPDTWTRLKAFGFVESDYSGPIGIKKELKQLVGELLKEYENGSG